MLSRQPITDVILSVAMEPRGIIREAREKRQWSQKDLAARAGISQVAVMKIESGVTRKSKFLPNIAQALELPLSQIDPSLSQYGDENINQSSNVRDHVRNPTLHKFPLAELMGDVDLPVHAIAQGGRGAQILESDPFTYTSRPKRLIGKKDGYGVLIKGNSLAKEYNEGDVAYVDPRLHPKKGDPCVFQGTREDGTVEAIIKYLERSPDASEVLYYVSQTSPPKKFTVKKADWQKCHVLVGKESGR
jgi:transcriptional regulator with XRE-family HTH domain